MSERLLRRQLADLGLTAEAPPDAAAWQEFLRMVIRTYRDADLVAGGIAHDFNNLLAVILGDAELAMESLAEDHPVRGDVEEIQAAGRRASLLTQQLLTFSRRHASDPQVVALDTIVTDMEKRLRGAMGEAIEMVATYGAGTGSVELDPVQAEQLIMHLATNARDAMPGGGRVLIETRNVELGGADATQMGVAPGRYVLLTVADDGTGGLDAAKATGLGLATVFGIVEEARGGIRVSSAPGQGSVFSVCLPRVDGS